MSTGIRQRLNATGRIRCRCCGLDAKVLLCPGLIGAVVNQRCRGIEHGVAGLWRCEYLTEIIDADVQIEIRLCRAGGAEYHAPGTAGCQRVANQVGQHAQRRRDPVRISVCRNAMVVPVFESIVQTVAL